jgi:hypothetical protein
LSTAFPRDAESHAGVGDERVDDVPVEGGELGHHGSDDWDLADGLLERGEVDAGEESVDREVVHDGAADDVLYGEGLVVTVSPLTSEDIHTGLRWVTKPGFVRLGKDDERILAGAIREDESSVLELGTVAVDESFYGVGMDLLCYGCAVVEDLRKADNVSKGQAEMCELSQFGDEVSWGFDLGDSQVQGFSDLLGTRRFRSGQSLATRGSCEVAGCTD